MFHQRKFDELCSKVKFCTRCERMEESARVLSRAAGPLTAKLMFIGEAPGRLGADAYEIPFHGDKAGHNFEELLHFVDLDRSKVFVTNAVLCNPKAVSGNNATPSKTEMKNCSNYLKEQIDIIQPKIVVTLGAIALEALNFISEHNLKLSEHVRTSHTWFGRKLIPIYHPGARAMIHRSMANQRSDYQYIADQLKKLEGPSRKNSGQTKNEIAWLAKEIIQKKGFISYFALHKLFFLVECTAAARLGKNFTAAFFIRQKDGPYCTDLHLAKLRKALPSLKVTEKQNKIILNLPQQSLFGEMKVAALPNEVKQIVEEVVYATGSLSDAELKTKVYLTAPMRQMLRTERTGLVNLYNSPIKFEVATREGNLSCS